MTNLEKKPWICRRTGLRQTRSTEQSAISRKSVCLFPGRPTRGGIQAPLAGRHDGDIHSALQAKSFSDVTGYQTICTLGANNPAISPSPGARGTVRIPPSGIVRCRTERRRAKCPASPWRGLDQPLSGPDRFPVANSLLRGEGGRCIGHGLLPASSHDGGRKRRLGPRVFGPQLSFSDSRFPEGRPTEAR